MTLTFAAAAFCNWQLASPALRQLVSEHELKVTELAGAAALEELKHAGGNLVLLYAPLYMALEQAAARGTEPSQAVALWQHNAALLARFCKKMRGKALLFSLADVLAAPQLFHTLCAQHWPALELPEQTTPAIKHTTSALQRLMAENMLASNAELQSLEQQLQALAQPLGSFSSSLAMADLDKLLADFQAGKQAHINWQNTEQLNKIAKQKLAEQTKECNQLKVSLATTQEQIKTITKECEHIKANLAAAEKQVITLTKERDSARNNNQEVAGLKQENSLLLEQLFTVQEALEKHLSPAPSAPLPVVAPKEPVSNKPAVKSSSLKGKMKKRAEKKQLQRRAAELAASSLFNGDWYLKQYPDVAADKLFASNPALHYLKCGGFEGRNPSPGFNSQDYLDANPDVAAAGFNPLYHYLRFGQAEKRPLY
ncbi:hypothetical protein [Oceanimonas sp. CAM02]|uniref:hypothetical protein n=1 Tax=Oceanimonas sp. CAM02 TaxID=3080336 RepID=UPI0029361D63|nr:hypothetical protein [Oceanimonas sp. CAM02]MDV2858865.1 hypothetical protein [Oceanimonas sp. CAM02]